MMPPAQDKTLEKDGRIRVSPPVLTRASDSSRDPDPPIATLDVGCARLWLNLASFSVVDSCSMKELPEIPNSTSDKADLQRSLGHLLGRVSTDESGADCPTLPEDSAFRKQSRNDHPIMASTLPIYQGESDRSVALKPVWDSHSAAPEDTDARRALLASQHAVLVSRAERAKLRLRALLGENALQTLNRQMSWKLSSLSPTSDSLRPAENMCINALGAQEEASCLSNKSSGQTFTRPPVQQRNKAASMEKSSTCVQLRRLALCGQAVLHDALRALDSDATDSSSDDDWDTTRKRPGSGCLGCEWRAQRDRAELASQWTWMKLRLSELDLQIKTVSQLHQNLLANKGGVVLAEAQPLTDLQIQQTLLTETAGLTLTAGHTHDLNSELDAEPSSPTRLLRNIERQSAQLSRIVNSLMSPLSETPSHCPVDKGDSRCWRGSRKRSFTSSHVYSTCIAKTDHKKRRMSCRGPLQSQVDVSRVCARTRPVLTYHKPRLFIMDQSGVAQLVIQSFSIHISRL